MKTVSRDQDVPGPGWVEDEGQIPKSWAAQVSQSEILQEEEELYDDVLQGRRWMGLADVGYQECHMNLGDKIVKN